MSIKKQIHKTNIWLAVILIYVSIINLFVIKSTPEIIAIQFAFLIIVFRKTQFRKFTKQWFPFIALFLVYEFLRGIVDNISPFYEITLLWIFNLEKIIFPKLPTVYLQEIFLDNQVVLNLAIFFYTIFFYYSFLTAFIIWLKKPELFNKYARQLLTISFVGLAIFFFIPTAPPWFVAKYYGAEIGRPIYQDTILASFSELSLYNYFIYGNPVAALPSLHVAWPAFTSFFLIKEFKKKKYYLSLIIPIMIGFSIVLTGEHFVLDVIAGFVLAWIFVKYPLFSPKRNNSWLYRFLKKNWEKLAILAIFLYFIIRGIDFTFNILPFIPPDERYHIDLAILFSKRLGMVRTEGNSAILKNRGDVENHTNREWNKRHSIKQYVVTRHKVVSGGGYRIRTATFDVAEGTGFEPVQGASPRVFKTRAFDHSANPPNTGFSRKAGPRSAVARPTY